MKGIQNQFLTFMSDNRAYEEWIHHVWKERKLNLLQVLESTEPRHWVDSFIFPKGNAGRYWEILSNKWKDELEDILKHKKEPI